MITSLKQKLLLLGLVVVLCIIWTADIQEEVTPEQISTCKFVAAASSVLLRKESKEASEMFLTYAKMLDLYQQELKATGQYIEVELDTDQLLIDPAKSFEDNNCLDLAEEPEINKFLAKAKQLPSRKHISA